ncbi:FAD-dependent oxidoreductase [Scleromatobacter humisilvae]|uniref:FAD-dependent oxidoreductase n=1 Tax=Scleromatobacter humisilvae TaxID=2897159 RepID=A0A9X1YHT8_9BURK|nr:FAD-dependent oxidoreductase [Scleromatobacter humisilvae]MCK9684667.1 FAD-dependent oxidoreductase [Scleromatobacter humisilvae]
MSVVGIAGAGIAGRLLAFQLARLGHSVEVFDLAPDAEAPQGHASHLAAAFTAAGMLSPLAELEHAPADIAERGWRSLDLWPGVIAALGPRHHAPGLFRRNGSVLVAHPGDTGATQRVLARMKAANARSARERALDAAENDHPTTLQLNAPRDRPPQRDPQALTHDALQALEPALLPGLQGWLLPGEGQVDATRLLPALVAESPGVRWHWGTRVIHVEPNELHVASRAPVKVDFAVDTRGLGARGAGIALRGVRGELLWLHAPGLDLRRPVRCIHARHRVYLVPRHGDLVIVGATEIDSEDRSPVSVRSTIELLTAAHSIVPQLAEARIVRLDTHLRPATLDQRPHLHCEPGLIRINGLFRHGFLLAPALVEEALERTGLMLGARRKELSHA